MKTKNESFKFQNVVLVDLDPQFYFDKTKNFIELIKTFILKILSNE